MPSRIFIQTFRFRLLVQVLLSVVYFIDKRVEAVLDFLFIVTEFKSYVQPSDVVVFEILDCDCARSYSHSMQV